MCQVNNKVEIEIKKALIDKNFTQEMLANAIGISPVSLNNKLKNKTQFKLNELVAISKVLNVDMNKLV